MCEVPRWIERLGLKTRGRCMTRRSLLAVDSSLETVVDSFSCTIIPYAPFTWRSRGCVICTSNVWRKILKSLDKKPRPTTNKRGTVVLDSSSETRNNGRHRLLLLVRECRLLLDVHRTSDGMTGTILTLLDDNPQRATTNNRLRTMP